MQADPSKRTRVALRHKLINVRYQLYHKGSFFIVNLPDKIVVLILPLCIATTSPYTPDGLAICEAVALIVIVSEPVPLTAVESVATVAPLLSIRRALIVKAEKSKPDCVNASE